jgi:hypothetical protein
MKRANAAAVKASETNTITIRAARQEAVLAGNCSAGFIAQKAGKAAVAAGRRMMLSRVSFP